jgi:hemoglobin
MSIVPARTITIRWTSRARQAEEAETMIRRILPCMLLPLLAGCMEGHKPNPLPRTPTLYARLGGEPGIKAVVEDLVANVLASDKIRPQHKAHLQQGDVAGLKRKLIDQIGEATGGPQKYKGKSMKDAHAGLGITDADFDALVEALVQALDKNKVGEAEKKELLGLLAPLRKDVVEK